MAGEMNWIYVLGVGSLGMFLLSFLSSRVPVRQKSRRGALK
jgi:hypothetical protein